MKKVLSLIIIVFSLLIVISGCNKKGINKVTIVPLEREEQEFGLDFKEPNVEILAQPYNVNQNLADITNISDFPQLSLYEKYMLYKNSFIIKGPSEAFDQPFDVYEKNIEEDIPSFITTDSIIHIYNLMCGYVTQRMEKERLVDELKEFTAASFNRSLEVYNGTKEENARKAALKSIAYFGIAMRLLEMNLPGGIPLEANRIIDNDVKKVKSRWGSGTSEIFPYPIDYTNYIVRGYYSKDTDLRNYYLTMMWYGNTPMMFDAYDEKNNLSRLDEQILMVVIITAQVLESEELRKLWDDIYKVSTSYLGNDCSLNIYDISQVIKSVYGEKIDFNKLVNKEKIQKVYELCKKKYVQRANNTIPGMLKNLDKGNKASVEFRLMSEIYNVDEKIYDNIVRSGSGKQKELNQFINGLYIPSVFGSEEAYSILKEDADEEKNTCEYIGNIKKLRDILCKNSGEKVQNHTINNSIYWILKEDSQPRGLEYPAFMTNKQWDVKKLITFSSAVSDARYPGVMTARDGQVEASAKYSSKNQMPGYVEPDVNLYVRMEYMARYIRASISAKDFTDSSVYSALDDFIDSVVFLKEVSIKELTNNPLTNDEELRLRNYAKELKLLTLNLVEGKTNKKYWDRVSRSDKSMARIKDIYQDKNQILQTAVGYPDYIYVIVPYKEELYLTRGSMFSYYEFINSPSKRVDDKEWRDIITGRKEFEQQHWIKEVKIE